MPTPLVSADTASGERKRRRKRDDPQNSSALAFEEEEENVMSPEEETRPHPPAPAAPAPHTPALQPRSPPVAPDAVDLTAPRKDDSPPLSSDVERFDGKIVYNPDGSAYIIEDPELSEGESSIPDLPRLSDGCIVDGRDTAQERQIEFPKIANAFYVSRTPSLYGALYGRYTAERIRSRGDAPVMHSYRVFSFRGGKDTQRPPSPRADCTSVPVKPILMCFMCKLSFGYAKSFVAHAQSDHSLTLFDSERDALARDNASAIIQCIGKDKEPLVSFLEPVGSTEPSKKSGSGSPIGVSEITSSITDKRADNTVTIKTENFESELHNGYEERRPSPPAWRPSSHSLISVQPPHAINASVQQRLSPNASPPFQPTPPAFLSGTTIGVCPDHLGGRPSGADCAKCEMILSSGRLGGPLSGMHSRNSCKTLKCPKCNWHYKYQETLEIHMKEKHPEAETSCIYCIAGQPHPRLARGETYTCGYKPYRCEVCNYSTTTKGNLSIHMQSDKHLNNMQELQNGGGVPPSETSLPPAPQHTPPGPHKPPLPHHSPVGKPKPTFRCDVCNYETNVARNLRIHMTSEKHTHNMLVLQQNVKHMQTLSALHHRQQNQQQLENLLHFHGGSPNDAPPPNAEAALADFAYNQALMIQLMTGGSAPGHAPPDLSSHADVGLNPETMEPPPEPADPEPERIFHCCICNCFSTDSLEALGHHLAQDRTKIREQEILALMGGQYVCKLCSYKTNLKANFQLHCKTDKHLQRLQHVNHVKEGGQRNDWKLKFSGASNAGGVQVRCCACDYYTNSAHKLQLHAAGARHEAAAMLLRHLRDQAARLPREKLKVYHCALCAFGAPARLPLLQHVRSVKHLQMEQIHQLQRRSEGKDPTPDVSELFQVVPQQGDATPNNFDRDSDVIEKEDIKHDLTPEQKMLSLLEQHHMEREREDEESELPGSHSCPFCSYCSNSEIRLHVHISSQHSATDASSRNLFMCPLCQDAFKDRLSLERHVMQIHSVNSEGLQRLLMLVDQSHWLNSQSRGSPESGRETNRNETLSQDDDREANSPHSEESGEVENEKCATCSKNFRNIDELCAHQTESGHLEVKQTPQGPGYVCWKKGCNQYFDNVQILQNHFKEVHAKNSTANMSVSEKHVYKYRCNQCSLAFKTVDKLQLHSQYHMIRDATKCILCARSFRSVLALQKHIETSHSELSEDEAAAFKRSLMNNPILLAGLQGPILDGSTNDLIRKESLKSPDEDMTELDERESSGIVADDPGQNDADNSDDSTNQYLEDYLNSQAMAEDSYNDPNRKYKCHRCKVAYTRQSYLTAHNKTLLHRKGEKLTYPMEKYLDPNRPFKCDVCKESFTQKNILLVHYNSVSHLHKLKRAMQEQQNNNNAPPVSPGASSTNMPANLSLTPKSTSSEEDERKRYKCNICKVAYTQGSTLDIHMRSVLHQTRASKLPDLAAAGHIDLSKPLIEQPDRQDPAKILQDVLSPKNTSPSSASSNGGGRSPSGARAPSPHPSPASPQPRSGSQGVSCDKCHASFSTGELLNAHRTTLCPFAASDVFGVEGSLAQRLDLERSAVFEEMVAKGNQSNKKNSQIYKHLLESFGFDLVMQYNENHQRRQLKLQQEREANEAARVPTPPPPPPPVPEEVPEIPEIKKSTCQHCNKDFSSVWVLKTHCEEVHKDKVPLKFLEQFAEHYKTEYERKVVTSPRSSSPVAASGPPPPSPTPPTQRDSSPDRSERNDPESSGDRSAILAAQVQEMQAALNMIQLQQQLGQMHPMVAQMLSLGLPLGLNVGALAAMNLQPPLVPLMMPPPPFEGMSFSHDSAPGAAQAAMMKQQQQMIQQQQQQANAAANQKRARTRITDDQLKILRAHFDINNSPSDEAINKMAKQSGLATKVIKHWFRNTLFKERQRNKDSPYNFNNPPSTTLNLEEYEKTGEAKVTPLNSSNSSDEVPPEKRGKMSPIPQAPTTPQPHPRDVKSEPSDDLNSFEDDKYNSYDNRHQEDKTYCFPSQSPAPSLTGSEHQNANSRPSTPPHISLNSLLQSQLDSIPATTIPQPTHPSMLPPKMNSSFTSPNSSAQNMMPTTPNRSLSPGRTMMECFGLSGNSLNGANGAAGSSGKRANRTRFTDYQIKVLQEFFENNAYPKDDDLEYLSKLLGLSPRVIVVWFQNARQKARKVYENQPAVEQPLPGIPDEAGANRFQRTPGLNYQCKKCQLVFQRYYELIRHQKTHCFKEEDAKRSAQAQAAAAQVAATLSSEDSNSSTAVEPQLVGQLSGMSHIPHGPHSNTGGSVPVSPAPHPPLTPTPTPSGNAYSISPVTTPTPSDKNNERDRNSEKDGSFQCDKCNLVFPRFELWREHQLVHLMNPNLFPTYPPDSPFGILQQHAQLQQLNASLGNGDTDPSRHPLVAMLNAQAAKRKFDDYELEIDNGDQPKDKRLRTTILPEQLDYLYQKYQVESNPSRKMLENIAREVGLKKRVVQVWFQNTRARERKGQFRAHAQVINKRCPFCPALFKVKSALESHLSTKHADQCSRGEINIDALPDEELSMESTPSFGSQQSEKQQNFSQAGAPMLPPIFPPFHSDMEKFIKQYSEESMKRYISELQAHATATQNGTDQREGRTVGEIPLDLSKPVDLSRPGSEGDPGNSDTASETMDYYDEDCDSDQASAGGGRQSNKRYRTQMSSIQVKIMKSIFDDYRTPTMTECETLGREIGLQKRVVQVWFQNARAKDKKTKVNSQGELIEPDLPEDCRLCGLKYDAKNTIQEHLFGRNHINTVRARIELSLSDTSAPMALLQMAARLEAGGTEALQAAFARPSLTGNGECTT